MSITRRNSVILCRTCKHSNSTWITAIERASKTITYHDQVRRIHSSNQDGTGQRAKATPKASTSIIVQRGGIEQQHHQFSPNPIMSTVERGTTYEEHVKAFLQNTFPKMDLMRVGGANDGGIDLTGWWWSPLKRKEKDEGKSMERIRIAVQCKSEARKLGPRHVREIHGMMITRKIDSDVDVISPSVLDSLPLQIKTESTVPSMAILASSSGFSKQCILQAFSAPFPLLLIHLLFPDQDQKQQPFSSSSSRLDRNSISFAHPTIVANDALLNGLLQSQLEVRWSSSIGSQNGKEKKSPPASVKIDSPSLYLGGKKLSS